MNDQPEALRLANALEGRAERAWTRAEVAAELRRQHAVNAELLEALVSFTKSGYIKKQHPKRYAAAVAAIARAEAQP